MLTRLRSARKRSPNIQCYVQILRGWADAVGDRASAPPQRPPKSREQRTKAIQELANIIKTSLDDTAPPTPTTQRTATSTSAALAGKPPPKKKGHGPAPRQNTIFRSNRSAKINPPSHLPLHPTITLPRSLPDHQGQGPLAMHRSERLHVNRFLTQLYNLADESLKKGGLSNDERLAIVHQCLDSTWQLAHQYQLDPVNVSTFLHRVSRLVAGPYLTDIKKEIDYMPVVQRLVQLLEGMLEAELQKVDQVSQQVQQDSNTATSSSSSSNSSSAFDGVSARTLATAFLATSWLEYPLTPAQLDKIAGVAMQLDSKLDLQAVASILSAFKAYAYKPFEGRVFQAVLGRALEFPEDQFLSHKFGGQLLVEITCAAAHAGLQPTHDELSKLVSTAIKVMPNMSSSNMAWLAWAWGKLGVRDLSAFRTIRDAVWPQIEQYPSSDLSMVMYGFSMCGFNPGKSFLHAVDAMIYQCLQRNEPLLPTAIANLMWAYSVLGHYPTRTIPRRQPKESSSESISLELKAQLEKLAEDRNKTGQAAESSLPGSFSITNGGGIARIISPTDNESYQEEISSIEDGDSSSFFKNRPPLVLTFRQQQLLAQQRQAERRSALAKLFASSSPSNGSPRASSASIPSSTLILMGGEAGSLAQKVASAQARRAALNDLLQLADSIAREARVQLASVSTSNSSTTSSGAAQVQHTSKQYSHGNNRSPTTPNTGGGSVFSSRWGGALKGSKSAPPPPLLSLEETSTSALAQAILTGKRPTAEEQQGLDQAAQQAQQQQQRIVRLSSAPFPSAEVVIDPASGKTIVQPHYELSDLFARDDQLVASEGLLTGLFEVERRKESGDYVVTGWLSSGVGGVVVPDALDQELGIDSDESDDEVEEDKAEEVAQAIKDLKNRLAEQPAATIDDLLQYAITDINSFNNNDIVLLIVSSAFLRHRDAAFAEAAVKKVLTHGSALSPGRYTNLLWGLGVLQYIPDDEELQALVQRVTHHKSERADASTLCKLSWVLCAMERLDPETFDLAVQAVQAQDHSALEMSDLSKLFQCALMLEVSTGRAHTDFLPSPLLELARDSWQSRSENVTTSRYQRLVAACLNGLGVPVAMEHEPIDSPLVIDIAVYGSEGEKVAVEVDGPHHFTANAPHTELASTRLRNALLIHHGWRVVSVPVMEWRLLQGRAEQERYLRDRVLRHIKSRAVNPPE